MPGGGTRPRERQGPNLGPSESLPARALNSARPRPGSPSTFCAPSGRRRRKWRKIKIKEPLECVGGRHAPGAVRRRRPSRVSATLIAPNLWLRIQLFASRPLRACRKQDGAARNLLLLDGSALDSTGWLVGWWLGAGVFANRKWGQHRRARVNYPPPAPRGLAGGWRGSSGRLRAKLGGNEIINHRSGSSLAQLAGAR